MSLIHQCWTVWRHVGPARRHIGHRLHPHHWTGVHATAKPWVAKLVCKGLVVAGLAGGGIAAAAPRLLPAPLAGGGHALAGTPSPETAQTPPSPLLWPDFEAAPWPALSSPPLAAAQPLASPGLPLADVVPAFVPGAFPNAFYSPFYSPATTPGGPPPVSDSVPPFPPYALHDTTTTLPAPPGRRDVAEPASLALLGIGLLALVGVRKWR